MQYNLTIGDNPGPEWGGVVMGHCLDETELINAGLEVRSLKQVHGARILDDAHYTGPGLEADGLVTDLTGVALVIRTADCVPIHMTDGKRLGMVHAGWRGTRAGIVRDLLTYFEPSEVMVVIGPCISGARYEVDRDLYQDWLAEEPALADYLKPLPSGPTKRAFDLGGFIHQDLVRLGVSATQIIRIPICTYDSPLPSYRRNPASPGRILNYTYQGANSLQGLSPAAQP